MKKFVIIIVLIQMIVIADPSFSSVYQPEKLKVFVTMDKRFFYTDEDVTLHIYVKNVSEEKNFFEVYDKTERDSAVYTTFQPKVYDMDGREAELIVPYRIEDRKLSDILPGLQKRLVELGPGESIIHRVNLKEIYNLKNNREYRLKALFYPEFTENRVISSDNEFSFRIINEKRYNKVSDVASISRSVEPKEIIMLALTAEKGKDWDNYIKYFNIEKYINSFPDYVRRYYRADYEKKSKIEKDFKKFLIRERDDYILDFMISSEEFEKDINRAYVEVIIDRFAIKRTNRYKYRYTLEKYRNIWLITELEATVMKGIKR